MRSSVRLGGAGAGAAAGASGGGGDFDIKLRMGVDAEERRERRTFKVWNGRLIQDAHMAAGGTLESFFEEHGFCLVHAPTQVTDFLDADQCVQRRGGV